MHAEFLIYLAILLVAAKAGGELFERFKQPAVLGELVAGVALGALAHGGVDFMQKLASDPTVHALAELGVIVLLFQVGLESNVADMMKVGASSMIVATVGVITPMALGFGVAMLLRPELGTYGAVFIGSVLCATSVGITARVYKDLGALETKEARIVLGAAVIDDVMGLVVLALVKGIIVAHESGGGLDAIGIVIIVAKAAGFLVGAIVIGVPIAPHLFKVASKLQVRGLLFAVALAFCFALAYAAARLGLAPIVGAFAAGLVLDRVHFQTLADVKGEHGIEEAIHPVAAFLVPLFFVNMGMQVDLSKVEPSTLGFAAALIAVAIVGKQVCSFGVLEKGLDNLSVGLGMIPRGEVGLIFAAEGARTLLTRNGVTGPVVDQETFGAIILMVMVTTMVTPPLLSWRLRRRASATSPSSAPS